MTRAALYMRVSSTEQAREGDSIPAQREALRQYAKDHEMIVADEYLDDGVSGTRADRDELSRLLSDVEAGRIDIILITKLDRLYRSIKHYLNMMDTLDRCHVGWLAIWENYDTTTPQGRFIVNSMMSIAQYEAENTSQRIKQVQRYKLTQHEVISGTHPAGFRIVDKHLVPDDNAPHVREAFEKYALCGNLNEVMREFSGQYGMPTSKPSFKKMLQSPLYKGEHYSGIKDFCPAIVPKELWEDVQRKLKINVKSNQRHVYIFSGLLRCADCGGAMGGNTRRRIRGTCRTEEYQYRCARHYNYKPCRCINSKSIAESTVEKYLIAQIPNIKLQYEIGEEKRADNTAKIKKIERKLDRLKDLYVEELIDLTAYKADRVRLLSELDKLSQEQPERRAEDLQALLRPDLWDLYGTFTNAEKRMFWRGIIERIEYGNDKKFTVHFVR